MLKRELKINFKSLIIWSSICIGLFLIAFIMYPLIIDKEEMASLSEMMKAFPPEMLKMFNMDISNIDNVFGWFKTEGYIFLLLIVSLYASTLGSNILVKEESDKTIEFLYSKPISRNNIVTAKVISGVINIISIVLIITSFNYIGMLLSTSFSFKGFILLSVSPLLSSIPLFFVLLYISTFFNKTKKTISLSMGITFIAYFLQLISIMGEKVEFFKYFTLFTLTDSRNIIINSNINIWCIIISIFISILFCILTYINYNKKELI